MNLIKFVQAVEADGYVCHLQTDKDRDGKTYAGIMVFRSGNFYPVAWAPITARGTVQSADHTFDRIEKDKAIVAEKAASVGAGYTPAPIGAEG